MLNFRNHLDMNDKNKLTLFHQKLNSYDLFNDVTKIAYVSKVNHGNMIAIPNRRIYRS